MRTQKQINASRANGARSNGPVTAESKAKSSQNATKHGLFSNMILLKGECNAGWEEHCTGLLEHYDPIGMVERGSVYELAVTLWRRERAEMIEARILDMEIDVITATHPPVNSAYEGMRKVASAFEKAVERGKGLITIQREIARLSRQADHIMTRLDKLQANRPVEIEPEPEPEPAAEPVTTETRKNGNEPGNVETPLRQQHPLDPNFGTSNDIRRE